jgi:phosphoenolpyruvate carboxykinase (ATP)
MKNVGLPNTSNPLAHSGLTTEANVFWNLCPSELIEHTIKAGQGQLIDTGALAVQTGEFTGRSPKDRFIVSDELTQHEVWWGNHNIAFEEEAFLRLRKKMQAYCASRDLYVRDAWVGSDQRFRVSVRVVNETAWSNLFVYNMFIEPTAEEVQSIQPEWLVLNMPSFKASPEVDGTRQHNFAIVSFKHKTILIGGTGYTGEIKKGMFSALNFLLPTQHNVMPMHCSANVGENGDTALFFGLSGTGKTTLSADPERLLIGDDEHGWADASVFNFEGGCYAKTIDLTEEKEPDIYRAIRYGALLENIGMDSHSRNPDYTDSSLTENTRVSYPIHYIDRIKEGSIGGEPKHIFYLTCDAYGILPPISKLTAGQAMYHFISGYTAKVAGTEAGITEPQTTFSACFGAPFMPLHPARYAAMLGERIKKSGAQVWLINTGWSGGPYGIGQRMKLSFTRAMIRAAMNGHLDSVDFQQHPIFGLNMPLTCPGVPSELLNPESTWNNTEEYRAAAFALAQKFHANFEKFSAEASPEILEAGPRTLVN